jgi:putative cell wall-binding protein
MKKIFTVFLYMILLFSSLPAVVSAQDATVCETEGCYITITINLAFTGSAANDTYIYNAAHEIETEWNGDDKNPSTYGDCKCPFNVKVATKKVANCTSAPGNFHCIEVTDYDAQPPYSANESVIERVKKGKID